MIMNYSVPVPYTAKQPDFIGEMGSNGKLCATRGIMHN